MKVKAIIHQVESSCFILNVPAIKPITNGFGKTVEQAVINFYSNHHIYQGEFQVCGDVVDKRLSEQDRSLEFYVYPGKYNLFNEQIRPFEQQAFEILEAFPGASAERTPDVIQIEIGEYGDEMGVIVILAPDLLEVRFPEIKWTGPHSLISVPKKWRRLENKKLQDINLTEFIHAAQVERQQTFQLCKYCGKSKPPGWMHSRNICDGCAQEHLGIIH